MSDMYAAKQCIHQPNVWIER